MYVETFAKKLAQARKDAGYTQRQIANFLNLKQGTLASYETGRTQPDIETLGKLADFYEVSTDWLIGTKGTNRIIERR
ncbi:MAG: helix-turn-helix transcriptional regulator [Oscillospiraceae bacterium]|nr:helix-turn-helix transcriptional regulator [Oscillospiraceae bacterium]MBR1528760.1 helix-turn-helix transcriptional regulator [Oscillospiraceae bacterium]